MQPAFDQTSIRLTLMRAVQNGRFTLDALDNPSGGFHQNTKVHPMFFKNGYQGVQHRNLLREDPAAAPTVQAAPHPKDFAEVLPKSNTPHEAQSLPLTLEQDHDEFVPF